MERRHLARDEMLRAVGMIQVGCSQIQVAAEFGVLRSVMCKFWERYQDKGDVAETHEYRKKQHLSKIAHELSADLQNYVTVSDQTIRNPIKLSFILVV